MLTSIPLFAFIVIAYNILIFSFPTLLSNSIFLIHLPSGADWFFSVNDLILTVSLVFLYFEVFRSTHTDTGSIMSHSLSMVVFVVCLIEFIVFKPLANSTFFLIMLMTLIDVIAGFIVTISAARRDVDYHR